MTIRTQALGYALACALLAPAAGAEVFQYTDAQGRLHFTQDLSQVPPEYLDQVKKRQLEKEINVAGPDGAPTPTRSERIERMHRRSQTLERTRPRPTRPAAPAAPRPPAPEPRKYIRDCTIRTSHGRCGRTLSPAWSEWNRRNGGGNGRPVLRSKPD